jgi:hypothetical protein
MNRRAALLVPLGLAACAGPPPTLVETIDAGTLPFPVMPGLVVPDVSLPPTQADREGATALAREALLRGIGERPMADPAPDGALLLQAQARGLPRVVRLTVVRADSVRSGLFGVTTVTAAIRIRVLDVRTGWVLGQATFQRASRSAEGVAAAITALAAGLLA